MKFLTFLFLCLVASTSLSSQILHVFNIDTTAYPLMKADFYSTDEEGILRSDFNMSDVQVFENWNSCSIVDVNTSLNSKKTDLSSLLSIDISKSMTGNKLDVAKEFVKTWISNLDNRKSECALTTFNNEYQILQDFTKNKEKLSQKLDQITRSGFSFIDTPLRPLMRGEIFRLKPDEDLKKIIILVTDGELGGELEFNYGSIAKKNDVTIFCVNIGNKCPDVLKDIVVQTGGIYFDNINTKEEASQAALLLKLFSQNYPAAQVEWEGKKNCDNSKIIDLQVVLEDTISKNIEVVTPKQSIPSLEFEPRMIEFTNSIIDLTFSKKVIVTARNQDIEIENITLNNPQFTIAPRKFSLAENESIELTIEFTPVDSSYVYSNIEFNSKKCSQNLELIAYKRSNPTLNKKITLTSPNGSEVLTAGENSLVTWEGVPSDEVVDIDFSPDNGRTWEPITNSAKKHKYNWQVNSYDSDSCLLRIHSDNTFSKCIGGNNDDTFSKIIETNDGYLIAGNSSSLDSKITNNHGLSDFFIAKLDKNLKQIWTKCYGGSKQEYLYNAFETEDGGFILLGITQSNDGDIEGFHGQNGQDIWVIRVDKAGKLVWQKCLGGSSDEKLRSVYFLTDGVVLVGRTYSKDGDVTGAHESGASNICDIWVVKIDFEGHIVWERALGGSKNEDLWEVELLEDKSIIISSQTESVDGDISSPKDYEFTWFCKLDTLGNITWENSLGGSSKDFLPFILPTRDNGTLFYGYSYSNDGNFPNNKGQEDAVAVKVNDKGEIVWQKSYGGSNSDDYIRAFETEDGDFILIGTTESADGDVSDQKEGYRQWICKIDSSGELVWERCSGENPNDYIYDCLIQDDRYMLFGLKYDTDHDTPKWWTQKLDENGAIIQENVSDDIVMASIIESKNDDGGLYLRGVKSDADEETSNSYWIFKLDKNLDITWEKEIVSAGNDIVSYVYLDNNNDALAILNVQSNISFQEEYNGKKDIGVVKLNLSDDNSVYGYSDDVFSISKPKLEFREIDLGSIYVNSWTSDTLIAPFIKNVSARDIVIKSVQLEESSVFRIWGIYQDVVLAPEDSLPIECSIYTNRHYDREETSEIIVVTQSDTLYIPIKVTLTTSDKVLLANNYDFYCDTIPIHKTEDKLIKNLFYNNIDTTINISKIKFIGYDKDQFAFIDSNQIKPYALKFKEQYDLGIRFQPTKIGRKNAKIAVYHDGDNSPKIFSLFGEGTGPEVFAIDDSARPNKTVDIKIRYSEVNGGVFADLVASCDGIIKVDASILEPQNPQNLIKIEEGIAYIKFSGIINPGENMISNIPLKTKEKIDKDSTFIDFGMVTWYDTHGKEIDYDVDFSSGLFKLLDPTNVKELDIPNTCSVYPNPASSQISIDYFGTDADILEVNLIDMLGVTVKTFYIENISGNTSITSTKDISDISSGHYILQIKSSKITKHFKLVIIR